MQQSAVAREGMQRAFCGSGMIRISGPAALAALLFLPGQAVAQRVERAGVEAFAIEAAGGAIGSAAGVGLGLALARIDRCDSEDLACLLSGLSVGGLGGAAGATIGTTLAGRAAGTRPSLPGALVGSLLGIAAGVGLVHLLTEEANLSLEKAGSLLVFSLTQGVFAAAGSRIGSRLRSSD